VPAAAMVRLRRAGPRAHLIYGRPEEDLLMVDFRQLVRIHMLEQYFVSIKTFQEKKKKRSGSLMKKSLKESFFSEKSFFANIKLYNIFIP
jgi:hypothetical protein